MTSLPALDIDTAVTAGGNLTVAFEYSEAWTDASAGSLASAVATFVAAGALGGYRYTAAAVSHLEVVDGPRARGAVLVLDLRAQNVDPRSFQYLRNLVGRVEFEAGFVQRVVVQPKYAEQAPRLVRHPLVDNANEEDAYPAPVSDTPFEVIRSEECSEKSRRVEISLRRAVVDEDIDEIARLGGIWGALLEGGAFALPFAPPAEVDSFAGEAALFNESAIEFDIPVYQASEAGWDVLLNMLVSTTSESLPIADVLVE